jgi:hypothetical protein
MPRGRPKPLSAKETVRVIAGLFDRYGLDHSPNRDRSRDGERFQCALYCAVRDGLIRLPGKRGPKPKWGGQLGLELIEAVESLRARSKPTIPKNKVALRKAIKSLRAGTLPPLKLLSVEKAIETLQEKYPQKWGRYHRGHLHKRFYDAKKVWTYVTRLMQFYPEIRK